jgi:type VI protein secretion system component VasK
VQGEVNALRLAFNTSPEDAVAVGSAIEGLLRAPVRFSQSIIGGSGGTAMEDEGRELCRSDGVVLQRFPFANGGRDASLDELDAFLHPDAGSLWAFMEKVRGAGLTPSREFQGLVDRARAASRALYALDAASPRLRFRFRGQPTDQVPTISLNVDGNAESYSRNATPWGNFTWNAANAQEVRMRVQVGERPDSLIFRGTWALFKFFNQADWQASGDSWRLSWRLEGTGATVQADLDLAGAQPVLRRGFFDGLSCPARFVR